VTERRGGTEEGEEEGRLVRKGKGRERTRTRERERERERKRVVREEE
jgi:hypothetical protein